MTAPQGPRPSLRWTGVCIDCADAEELAGFTASCSDGRRRTVAGEVIAMGDPSGGRGLLFQAEAA